MSTGALTPGFVLETDEGLRVGVSGDRLADPGEIDGRSFSLGSAEVRPGLANAHDHLTLNHYPRLGNPPYTDLYEWADDVQRNFVREVEKGRLCPLEDALRFGIVKNLVGGVARVVHHDPWHPVLDEELPVRVERVRALHSLGLEPDLDEARKRERKAAGDRPLCMHLAEGIDERAAAEVAEAARLGLLGDDFLAVHLVGVDAGGIGHLETSGSAFVWCPGSNLHLYGRTAPEPLFRADVDMMLGTDSLLSGEGTLLDELRTARRTGLVDDAALEAAVTTVPARRLGAPEPSLDVGAPADVLALRKPLFDARPVDVALSVVAGRPRYGDPALAGLFEDTGVDTEVLEVGGQEKLVQAPFASLVRRVVEEWPAAGRILE